MKQIIINNDNLSRYSKRLKKILSEKYNEIKLHEAENILAKTLGSSSTHELRKTLKDDITETKNTCDIHPEEKTFLSDFVQISEGDFLLQELSKFFKNMEITKSANRTNFIVQVNNIFCDYFILDCYRTEELNDVISVKWHKGENVEDFCFVIHEINKKELQTLIINRIERIIEFFAELSGVNYCFEHLDFLNKWEFSNHNIMQKSWRKNVIHYILNGITMAVERKSYKHINILDEKYYIYFGKDFTNQNNFRILVSKNEYNPEYMHMLLSYPYNAHSVLFEKWFEDKKIKQFYDTLVKIENLNDTLENIKKEIEKSLPSNVVLGMKIEGTHLVLEYMCGKDTITVKSNLEAFFEHAFRDIRLVTMEQDKNIPYMQNSWAKNMLVPNIALSMEIVNSANNSKYLLKMFDGKIKRIQTIKIMETDSSNCECTKTPKN